jgi:hypothetical protein
MPECDHNCDPMDSESRRLNATHYLDCPVWTYLGATTRVKPPAVSIEE